MDWNEDGLLDLLLGSDASTDGIRLYLNSGTKTQYQFTSFTKIKANNADIALSRCQIQVLDLNSDGKKDLVAGNGLTASSRIYFYENSGTNASPVLKAAVALQKTDNTPIGPVYDVHFCFADWNEDGVPDVIYTEYSPNDSVHLYLGQIQSDISHKTGFDQTTVYKKSIVTHGKCVVSLNLKNEQNIHLKLFNNSGRLIESKHTGLLKAGEHKMDINLTNNHAGIYLLRYTIDNQEMKQKIVLIR